MARSRWEDAIERMLGRMRDTARRVGDRFPHWANTDIVGTYYLFESLLILSGVLESTRV